MKLRIKFSKYGVMKYIGHLDMVRYFQKAIRRANLDVVYSAGFSPHQVMSFAAPLGVGLESEGEYMDIEVNSITSSEDMIKRLNDVMVKGIEITNMTLLPEGAGNAMASVAAAAYTVTFRNELHKFVDFYSQCKRLFMHDEIIITKKTKKSTTQLNIKPFIFQLNATKDNQGVFMIVDASSSGNIKPKYVIDALFANTKYSYGEFDLLITRMETYGLSDSDKVNDTETDENIKKFKALSEMGEAF